MLAHESHPKPVYEGCTSHKLVIMDQNGKEEQKGINEGHPRGIHEERHIFDWNHHHMSGA